MTYVSVVIPAFDAAATIGETLRALQSQAGIEDFEIIVVDNASRDGTAEIARKWGARVLYEPVRGPAAARNCGLHAASGKIIAHLDADTVPTRRWLAELCAPFSDPAETLAAGRSLSYPPVTAAERFAAAIGLNDATLAVRRQPFPFAPSLNLAVRRAAALGVGGWNSALITGEDVDFSHRILRAYGGPIAYRERAILYHHARSDDAALRRQAWTYGAGVADLYRLYPEEARWNAIRAMHVLRVLALRAAQASKSEFARYHWMWTRSFWLGFATRKYLRRPL